MNQCLIIDIHISAEDYLQHYQGHVQQVHCTARDGRKIRFPTKILQPFVSHEGIHGTFEIEFDKAHKLVDIKRL